MAIPRRRIYQIARSRGIYARKHHRLAGERTVQALTAATFPGPRGPACRATAGSAAAGFLAHAHAALDPYAEPAIEEAAADHNRGAVA